MKPNFFIALLALLFITSCVSHEESTSSATSSVINTDMPKPPITPVTKAREIVENNTYIDVDMAALDRTTAEYIRAYGLSKHNITEELYPEEEQMARAALYRFYSKIVVEDGLWVATAKSAEELNMSERTFKYMDNNIKQMHEQGMQARAEGMEVECPPISADYLESLIR